MPEQLCACGCGHLAGVHKRSNKRLGIEIGAPRQYLPGHNLTGSNHHQWRGGRRMNGRYVMIWNPKHHRADNSGYVREHILVAEAALGRPLPDDAVVHHVDHDTERNAGVNLVICQDQGYHRLLHQRERALNACGHADWRQCYYCRGWDAPDHLYIPKSRGGTVRHRECRTKADRHPHLDGIIEVRGRREKGGTAA